MSVDRYRYWPNTISTWITFISYFIVWNDRKVWSTDFFSNTEQQTTTSGPTSYSPNSYIKLKQKQIEAKLWRQAGGGISIIHFLADIWYQFWIGRTLLIMFAKLIIERFFIFFIFCKSRSGTRFNIIKRIDHNFRSYKRSHRM